MMHAKIMTVDGVAALVGSSNLNRRSLQHDEEVVLTVLDEDFTAELDRDFDHDLTRSTPIEESRWRHRRNRQVLLELLTAPVRRFL